MNIIKSMRKPSETPLLPCRTRISTSFCQTPPSLKEKWKDKIYLASLAGVRLCFPMESRIKIENYKK